MTTNSIAVQTKLGATAPYSPSFIDKFMQFIQRLPLPYWVTYLALFILQCLFNHVIAWTDGWLPVYTLSTLNIIYPLWTWLPLILMTYLNAISVEALSKFSPLLDISAEEMQALKYEFTTMPSRGVILSECILAGLYIVFTYVVYATYISSGFGMLAIVDSIAGGLGVFFVGYLIVYHTIRQLRLVNRTVRLAKHFDLFNLNPVYAFSVFTSHTGIGWILLTGLTLLTIPIQVAPSLVLFTLMAGSVLALVSFVVPLWIVHQHLAAGKNKLAAEHDQRVKLTLARLHHLVEEHELSEADHVNSLLEGLGIEGKILEKIRTWPWSTETLTGVLSASVLPILLFLIQIAIKKWLNI